jgi:glycosyltransferase involved in cell wall biosynthesis
VRVSVVIPTFNEAKSIGRVLTDIPETISEVLVVDSDSSDGTAAIAREMGAKVLREPRRGYGRACLTGLDAANAPDVVVFLDGDYSDRPAQMPAAPRAVAPGRRGHGKWNVILQTGRASYRPAGSSNPSALSQPALAIISHIYVGKYSDSSMFRKSPSDPTLNFS